MIRGIRLGMTLKDFESIFPKVEVSKLHEEYFNYKMASVYDWKQDAYRISLNFLDDKVARIETQFKSLENTRHRKDFYKLIAQTIRLHPYWEPFQDGWECQDFIVEVTPNKIPTITVSTKEFIRSRDKINEEHLKMK